MLDRVLEPELMDTPRDAADYDAMDHREVNRRFVEDLLACVGPLATEPLEVLDLGCGTAQIPIELCRRAPAWRVVAVDAAASMLDVARTNAVGAGLADRIQLQRVDAKRLPYPGSWFPLVVSNSMVHHIPNPGTVLAEAVRVTADGGRLFFRDLARPGDETALEQLVATYAAGCNDHQRQLFADSLRAALTVAEVRALVAAFRFDPATVQATSDRHWTWAAEKPLGE